MIQIDVLDARDARAAAGVLARAFSDSPVYAAVLGDSDDSSRVRTLERVKRGFVAASVHHGTCRVARDGRDILGVSLVLPPHAYPLSIRDEILQSAGCATAGPTAIVRFLRLSAYLRKRHLTGPHFYLFVLGVEPSHQGRGIGKQLLAKLHARADAENARCYLETEKAVNVRLYESVGYRVVTDEQIPGLSSVRMWTMVRPPAEAGSRFG
jgi:ribosomal protein S18 acetylase RimI-like enzyme